MSRHADRTSRSPRPRRSASSSGRPGRCSSRSGSLLPLVATHTPIDARGPADAATTEQEAAGTTRPQEGGHGLPRGSLEHHRGDEAHRRAAASWAAGVRRRVWRRVHLESQGTRVGGPAVPRPRSRGGSHRPARALRPTAIGRRGRFGIGIRLPRPHSASAGAAPPASDGGSNLGRPVRPRARQRGCSRPRTQSGRRSEMSSIIRRARTGPDGR